jgi:hypothetical protein
MRERAWVRTMSARRAIAERRVDPVDVFIEGLIERIGQDGVQEIIAAAFRPLREDAP